MQITSDQNPLLLAWATERLGVNFFAAPAVTLSGIEAGEIVVVIVYTRFATYGCEMSIASVSPRWCTRRFLREAFRYPFEQCGYERVTFVTTPSNARTVDLCSRLGAQQEGRLRRWFGDEDGIVFGLLRDEAQKWLR